MYSPLQEDLLQMPMLSAIIITKNEETIITDCLKSLAFCDEIIVVDSGNTDNTNQLATNLGAKIVPAPSSSTGAGYATWRNIGLAHAKGDWLLFVDADERVSPELAKEIVNTVSKNPGVFQIPRKNIYLGREMHYGGWGGDKVIRLLHRSLFDKYQGELHEQPIYRGTLSTLNNQIIHYSHRDLSSMLTKTIGFTAYEAQLRFAAGHPPMAVWRFIRVMLTEFYLRFIKLQAWRDGPEGIIDGIFQVFNTFVIYARLWELQQKKSQSS